MTEKQPQGTSREELKEKAEKVFQEGRDIRTQVHDLTLEALAGRRFDPEGIRDVVRTMGEGIASGAQRSGENMHQVVSEALAGLDQALMRSVEAGRLALEQLLAEGRRLSDRELQVAFDGLRRLEEDFLATVEQVAEAAGEGIRPELREALARARHNGTETGREVARLMTELGQRISKATLHAAFTGVETAVEVGARFAQVAGGILSGLADCLRERRSEAKR
jgi:hypothetical protein